MRRLYEGGFPAGFEEFAARVAEAGRTITLRMTLLKLTVPGVPDIYQGDERETLLLVDPDNRRPVRWPSNTVSLAPGPKADLVARVLALRCAVSDPTSCSGPTSQSRRERRCAPFSAGPTSPSSSPALPTSWTKARLEGLEGRWRDLLSGEEIRLSGTAPATDAVHAPAGALLVRA